MRLSVATKLIEKGVDKSMQPQVWADLGCGTGLFTEALGSLLYPASSVYAIDKDPLALKAVKHSEHITIERLTLDFTQHTLPFTPHLLDGVLMANALHYVADPVDFINKIKTFIKPSGAIILVEYDTNTGNPWVPYPISFASLQALALHTGLKSVIKMEEVPSRFHHNNIYGALLKFSHNRV